jgi:hypothetical protein
MACPACPPPPLQVLPGNVFDRTYHLRTGTAAEAAGDDDAPADAPCTSLKLVGCRRPSCRAAKLPAAELPSCRAAKLPSGPAAQRPSCQAAKLPSCQAAQQLPSCPGLSSFRLPTSCPASTPPGRLAAGEQCCCARSQGRRARPARGCPPRRGLRAQSRPCFASPAPALLLQAKRAAPGEAEGHLDKAAKARIAAELWAIPQRRVHFA